MNDIEVPINHQLTTVALVLQEGNYISTSLSGSIEELKWFSTETK